jgi:hypothetical protein
VLRGAKRSAWLGLARLCDGPGWPQAMSEAMPVRVMLARVHRGPTGLVATAGGGGASAELGEGTIEPAGRRRAQRGAVHEERGPGLAGETPKAWCGRREKTDGCGDSSTSRWVIRNDAAAVPANLSCTRRLRQDPREHKRQLRSDVVAPYSWSSRKRGET